MSSSPPLPERVARALAIVAVGILMAGCASTKQSERDALSVATLTSWYVGNEREGASHDTAEAELLPDDGSAYLRLVLDVRLLDGPAPQRLDALSHHAVWVSSTARSGTLLPTGDTTASARFAPPGPAVAALRADIEAAELPSIPFAGAEAFAAPGATVEFELRDEGDDPEQTRVGASGRFVLRASRPLDAVDTIHVVLGLTVVDSETSRPESEIVRLPPIELTSTDTPEIALLLASPMEAGSGHGLVILLRPESMPVGPTSDNAVADWRTAYPPRTFDDIRRARSQLEAAATYEDFEAALELLSTDEHRRASLALLARESGATLARDLALTAPDSLLARLAEQVTTFAPPDSLADLGWILEVSGLFAVQEARLADALEDYSVFPMLVRRVGVIATSESHIARIVLEEADSLASFEGILERENFKALLDHEASARVRAHDWLARRGDAPPGYDPLASSAERRAALERYLEQHDDGAGE